MPKAKWWDPWKFAYKIYKWSLNIDLCLKLRLHYVQLRLLPKQWLACWPELDLIFGSKSQKLCPQCSDDGAEETQNIPQQSAGYLSEWQKREKAFTFCISLEFMTFSFCSKSLTLPEQKDLFFCTGQNSLLVYYQYQSWQLRGGIAHPSLQIYYYLVLVQVKLQHLRKNISSHSHKHTLLTSFNKLVSLAGKTGLRAQGIPAVADLGISKPSNKLQPWLNLSLRSTEYSRVHAGAPTISEKSKPLLD